MSVLKIRHWIACSPQDVWDAYTTPEKFCQFFAPEGLSIPLESVVLEIRVGGGSSVTWSLMRPVS